MYKTSLSHRARILLTGWCYVLFLVQALAQGSETYSPQRGFIPAGSYSLSDVEIISTTNGNLSLKYPLGSLPPGRSGLSANINLLYNSKLYDTHVENVQNLSGQITAQNLLGDNLDAGWRYGNRYELRVINRNSYLDDPFQCPDPHAIFLWKVKLLFPDGSEHVFRPVNASDYYSDAFYAINPLSGQVAGCPNQGTAAEPVKYYSADGTYSRLEVYRNGTWNLYLPNGGRVLSQSNGFQRVYDSNNNYLEYKSITLGNGHVAQAIVDQNGRSTYIDHDDVTGDDLIVSNGFNGELLTTRVKWKTITVQKNYRTTAWNEGPQRGGTSTQTLYQTFSVVDQIILPTQMSGMKYVFNYNCEGGVPSLGWGEVSSLTMPSGEQLVGQQSGQAAYQYDLNGNPTLPPTCKDVLDNHVTTKTLTYLAQYDGANTTVTDTWQYDVGHSVTVMTAPDGGQTTEFHGDTSYLNEMSGLVYKVIQPNGYVNEKLWAKNVPNANWLTSGNPLNESNPFVKMEFNSIKDGAGNLSKTAIRNYNYDKNGNVTRVEEYDWVPYSSVPRDGAGNPTGLPSGATPTRVMVNTIYNPTPDSSVTNSTSTNNYWLTTNGIWQAAESSETQNGSGVALSRTESFYDSATTTGNVIEAKSWDSTKGGITRPLTSGNSISIGNSYSTWSDGATGRLDWTRDANSNYKRFYYLNIGNGVTELYVTKVITGDNAAGTSTIKLTSEMLYDFSSGVVKEGKDVDNNIRTITNYDAFARPIQVREAAQTSLERQTNIIRSDTARRIVVRKDQDATGDGKMISIQHFDQLGRVRLSRTLENGVQSDEIDETKGVKVQTRYFSGNSSFPNAYTLTSNPYRTATSSAASSETTMGWSRQKNDQAGRLLTAQTFGGAGLPEPFGTNASSTGTVTTSYDGNLVTVTDQAGKNRRSETDALGRLKSVWENPTGLNYQTNYSYDALDNLTTVSQGVQTRTFAYNSLKRLTQATNPESGTTSYTYDNNGNLATKVDAMGRSLTYYYDALNRSQGFISNQSNTWQVAHYYDGAANGKGRLNYSMTFDYYFGGSTQNAKSQTTIMAYDALGRPLTQYQQFRNAANNDWIYYLNSRTYDLAGNVKSQTYPSGRVVNYDYNTAGQMTTFKGNLGDGTNRVYASEMTYNPAGQMLKEAWGKPVAGYSGMTTPLYQNKHYNNRLQMYDVRLGTNGADEWTWNRGALRMYYSSNWVYGNGGQDNNGNVYRMDHFVPGDDNVSAWTMSLDYYQYDALNRITGIWENKQSNTMGETSTGLSQQYTYDRYGNRTVSFSNFPGVSNLPFNVDPTNNRLLAPNGTISYNAVGNQTNDNYTGAGARTYDANNRLITAAASGGGTVSYSYNASASRVTKTIGSTTTWYIYGLGGELVAEYPQYGTQSTPQIEYGYRGSQMLVTYDSTETGNKQFQWLVQDHLGSTRMVADLSGSLTGMKRHDYLPFGEEILANSGGRTTTQGYPPPDDKIRQKFTGYERDAETGLDYAQARMFSGAQGRFTSVDAFDPILGKQGAADAEAAERELRSYLRQPQHWNRYVYALNNPCKYIDPDGMDPITVNLNIVWSKKSNYTKEEKIDIINTYVADATKAFGKVDIKFNITQSDEGTVSNVETSAAKIETGAVEKSINVFFTKGSVGDSTEHTNYKTGEIFISTGGKERSDLTHGIVHAAGIAAGNGYANVPRPSSAILKILTAGYDLTRSNSAEAVTRSIVDYLNGVDQKYYGYGAAKADMAASSTARHTDKDLANLKSGIQKYVNAPKK